MATNRQDTLDPALLRPGRLDRKIEFPLPDRRQKRLVFQVVTGKMNVSEEVDLEDYVSRPDKISAADITAICQEAGMLAVRKNRYIILPKDFERAYKVNFSLPTTAYLLRARLNKEPTNLASTNKRPLTEETNVNLLFCLHNKQTSIIVVIRFGLPSSAEWLLIKLLKLSRIQSYSMRTGSVALIFLDLGHWLVARHLRCPI